MDGGPAPANIHYSKQSGTKPNLVAKILPTNSGDRLA